MSSPHVTDLNNRLKKMGLAPLAAAVETSPAQGYQRLAGCLTALTATSSPMEYGVKLNSALVEAKLRNGRGGVDKSRLAQAVAKKDPAAWLASLLSEQH